MKTTATRSTAQNTKEQLSALSIYKIVIVWNDKTKYYKSKKKLEANKVWPNLIGFHIHQSRKKK